MIKIYMIAGLKNMEIKGKQVISGDFDIFLMTDEIDMTEGELKKSIIDYLLDNDKTMKDYDRVVGIRWLYDPIENEFVKGYCSDEYYILNGEFVKDCSEWDVGVEASVAFGMDLYGEYIGF